MAVTRPGEIGRADAQRIAHETAALLSKADNEREYREHVLVTLARLEVKFDSLEGTLEEHIRVDEVRHVTITQKVNSHSDIISRALGICTLLVVSIGVIIWIIDKVTPA